MAVPKYAKEKVYCNICKRTEIHQLFFNKKGEIEEKLCLGCGIRNNLKESQKTIPQCDKCTILDKLIENKLICSEQCDKRKWDEESIDVEFNPI